MLVDIRRFHIARIEYRFIIIIAICMVASILVISSATNDPEGKEATFWTPLALSQLRAFSIGIVAYVIFSILDYRSLRKGAPLIYVGSILLLLGLFFTPAIQNVHRWYKIPGLPFALQPSEFAKVALIIMLSFYLEAKQRFFSSITIVNLALFILIPFVLILKQPDLGSALVLLPMSTAILSIGGISKTIIRIIGAIGVAALLFVVSIFLGVLSHEEMKPYALEFFKEYQYERLNPNNYHQNAAQTAIALGKITGSGWNQSEFTAHHWLPFAYTDSAFPAFVEEFGLIGGLILLICYFGLIYLCFQVTAVARDPFGQMLACGVALYVAMHVLINIGMMCGLLPITGVPLLLISYGGSSILATMIALGIVQSIYIRRFYY